jgi:hypothetical protein
MAGPVSRARQANVFTSRAFMPEPAVCEGWAASANRARVRDAVEAVRLSRDAGRAMSLPEGY